MPQSEALIRQVLARRVSRDLSEDVNPSRWIAYKTDTAGISRMHYLTVTENALRLRKVSDTMASGQYLYAYR